MSILIINIKELLQVREPSILKVSGKAMNVLPKLENAYLLIEDDTITDFGSMDDIHEFIADQVIDASDKIVLPAWCDSHTHTVFAGHREQEFVDRINGLSYEEIANRGGGILNSAEKLANTSEEELFASASKRLIELIKMGTGALEIKSGYGLSTESELKMLRVIKRLKENFPITIKATFLGAHAVPLKYKNNNSNSRSTSRL